MSDNITGINIVNPTYPVKRIAPTKTDDKSGQRREQPPKKPSDDETNSDAETNSDDENDKPIIDEYV